MKFIRPGFTLIELLVVVAVIAILAAIAVPNFLEALSRSKVSRAKADMRSLATAIESYHVDRGEYPFPDDEEGEVITDLNDPPEGFETRIPARLTTPIAYMAGLPADAFPPEKNTENPRYLYSTQQYFGLAEDPEEFDEFMEALILIPNIGSKIQYYIASRGPDLDHEETIGNDDASGDTAGDDESGPALYDPTNGTISNGDMLYFGPGLGYRN